MNCCKNCKNYVSITGDYVQLPLGLGKVPSWIPGSGFCIRLTESLTNDNDFAVVEAFHSCTRWEEKENV